MNDRLVPSPDVFEDAARHLLVPAAAALCTALTIAVVRHLMTGAAIAAPGRSLLLALHVATVAPAIPLGAYLLVRRKGDALHRRLGRIWAGLMFITALVSFALHSLTGGFSPIHLLSILTVLTVVRGVWQAMRGDIIRHRRSMVILYASMLVAGAFVFLPGRLFGDWMFR